LNKKVKLGDIAQIKSGFHIDRKNRQLEGIDNKAVKTKILAPTQNDSVICEVTTKDIFEPESINKEFFTKKDDIVFNIIKEGEAKIIREEDTGILVPLNFLIIRIMDITKYDPTFLVFLLNYKKTKNQISRLSESSSMLPRVTRKDLSNLKLNIPDYNTQKEYGLLMKMIEEKIKIKEKTIQYNKDSITGLLDKIEG